MLMTALKSKIAVPRPHVMQPSTRLYRSTGMLKAARKSTHQLVCAFVVQGPSSSSSVLNLDAADAAVARAITEAAAEIGGRLGATSVVSTLGRAEAHRVMVAGIGKKETADTFRFAAGRMAQRAREMGVAEFVVAVPKKGRHCRDPEAAAAQIVEGAAMSLSSFDAYKSEKAKRAPRLGLLVHDTTPAVRRAVARAEAAAGAVVFTRGVANMPPNDCTPAELAKIAGSLAKGRNSAGKKGGRIKCTTISGAALKSRGFGGIAAVGGGSVNEPRLIILEYRRGGKGSKTAKKARPIVLVGKAVTFDTGGISIKPGEKMDEMKFDKCGGCTVMGIIKAAAELEMPHDIIALIPAVENMPDGRSYRPGDIIRLYSGKTAEIINTDAEGRLILADALAYGEKTYAPHTIIDFATLTGACIVALGNNVAGMVTNSQGLADRFAESSSSTAEEVWRLPINDDYSSMIKSEVADIKNMGVGRAAGTIAAAAFLKEAIADDTPWVHFDIAGVAWTQPATRERPYNPRGATGFGVRLVLDYLDRLSPD